VLSIRRRQGPYEFRKETFGDPDPSWPNWGELGPILLRSAGIVGIAAVIMVIAAGDTLFRGPVRGPQAQPAAMAPEARSGPADVVAAAVAETEPAPSDDLATAAIREEPPAGADPETVADAAGPAPEPVRTVAFAAASAEILDAGALRLESIDDFDPLAFAATGAMLVAQPVEPRPVKADEARPDAAVAPEPSDIEPSAAEPIVVAARQPAEAEEASIGEEVVVEPSAAEPIAVAARQPAEAEEVGIDEKVGVDLAAAAPFAVAAQQPVEAENGSAGEEDGVEQGSTGQADRVEVAAISSAPPMNGITDEQAPGASGDESLWEEHAAECPRDWLSSSVPAPTASLTEDCEPRIVLVAPAELRGTGEAGAGEPSLDQALENAASVHAMELAGFVARLPRVRPDPPPVRRVRSTSRRADWPAAAPPDCGSLHAYWRFVDRRAGTKEWYCK